MLNLLSPAKKLNLDPVNIPLELTSPALTGRTKALARIAKQKSAADLKKLMGISDALAQLNADRYRAFHLNGRSNSAKPALLTFDGDVYWGLEAKTLSPDDLAFAQDHIRILSGLYGVLRPLDTIQPYRLEMGTRLKTDKGNNLYDFWGSTLSKALNKEVGDHKDKTIVNLASNEYAKAGDRKTLAFPILNASFLDIKDGKARSLMFYAKRARGLMARWIVTNRIETADDLRGFNAEGYKLDASRSDDSKLVFTRKQPPPKNRA